MNCDACGALARLLTGDQKYPHRPDLASIKLWECTNGACGAYVGCHDGTDNPKGTFAGPQLRALRMACHRLFDPLWQNYLQAYPEESRPRSKLRRVQRLRAYEWLTEQLGLTEQAHIGQSDARRCEAILSIIRELKPTPSTIRAWAKARRSTSHNPD